MNYHEIKPSECLKDYIKCFWFSETADYEARHTILPDGYFDLIVEMRGGEICVVKLTGVWTKPINVVTPPNTKLFSMRFKLLAAEYLFQREIKSILDTMQQLPLDFWQINQFNGNTLDQYAAYITDYLTTNIAMPTEINNRKIKLFDLAYQQKTTSVAEIAKQVGWRSRQINRYFNSVFGFSLKQFLDIIRFRKSFKYISKGQIHPENNYFDQSHFIKEVKKYAGVTPKELYKNEDDRFLQLKTLQK